MDSSSESLSNGQVFDLVIQGCREGRSLIVAANLIELTKKRRKEVLAMRFTDEKGATPLWCAAAISNFDLVNLLFDHDADINRCTKTNSSPLRAACFCGNLKIVQFLIEKGADIETANIHSNTCLMVASYRGHLEVVEYLLDKGANPNIQDTSGCTALHFAVEGSQLDIVKELVNKGCDINIVNESGLTAPFSAADTCNSEMVDFFCSLNSIPPILRISLLELLGASHANDKDRYDAGKAYHYFYLAIAMREHENLPKATLPPVEAYMNRKECETCDEVLAIRGDLDAIHLESLIVRERILGSDNVEIPHPIVYRGAVYADGLQFSRGISLWQRALDLKQRNNREAVSDIYRFAEVFSQMVVLREEIDIDALVRVLESCLLEATRRRNELETVKNSEDHEKITIAARRHHCPHEKMTREETIDILEQVLEGNILAMLYLLLVVTKCAKIKSDLFKCCRVIYQDVCSFPNSDMCRLLLNCGADPNAVCNDGNTPLHLIVQYAKPISDFVTLHQAITDLLEAGAHPDTRNRAKKSPIDLSTTGVAEIILKKESTWSLKCFAARAIRKYDLPYVGQVPVSLEKFIEKH